MAAIGADAPVDRWLKAPSEIRSGANGHPAGPRDAGIHTIRSTCRVPPDGNDAPEVTEASAGAARVGWLARC